MGLEIRVDLSGPLAEHVRIETGEDGSYVDAAEYVRDLIRRDAERFDEERFLALRDELQRAFAAPESEFSPLDTESFMARLKQRVA